MDVVFEISNHKIFHSFSVEQKCLVSSVWILAESLSNALAHAD